MNYLSQGEADIIKIISVVFNSFSIFYSAMAIIGFVYLYRKDQEKMENISLRQSTFLCIVHLFYSIMRICAASVGEEHERCAMMGWAFTFFSLWSLIMTSAANLVKFH